MKILLFIIFLVSWPVAFGSAIIGVEPDWLLVLLWASPLITGWFYCAYCRFVRGV